MLKWFKEWKAERRRREFDRGFGHVMTQYYFYGQPEYYLSFVVFNARDDINVPFQDGAEAAVRMLPEDSM